MADRGRSPVFNTRCGRSSDSRRERLRLIQCFVVMLPKSSRLSRTKEPEEGHETSRHDEFHGGPPNGPDGWPTSHSSRRRIDDAKQIPVRISQHDVIRTWFVSPVVPLRSQANKARNLSFLIRGIEVEVYPASRRRACGTRLERHVGTASALIVKHHPSIAHWSTRRVAEGRLPEGDHLVEAVAVNDDRSDTRGNHDITSSR